MDTLSATKPLRTIEPRTAFSPILEFREVWRHRELLYILAWRDFKVRYRQTAIGIAWAVFQPLISLRITTSVAGALNLADGLADSRLAPTEALAQAYQRALRRHGQELLQFGEPQGNRLLREGLAQWLSERHGIVVTAEQVLVTRGSRMAVTLVATALLKHGAAVAVENPGNPAAWGVFRRTHEADLRPVDLDAEGPSLAGLERALAGGPLSLLYVTPRRQVPTGAAMTAARAEAILAWAAQNRVAILEDDADGEIRFQEGHPLPMLARDRTGQVLFTASLSRLLAPGVRLGFLVVPATLVAPLARVRRDLEWQGDRVLEWAVADLMRDGEVSRHLRRVRKTYAERLELLAGLLKQHLGGAVAFDLPQGGLSLWLRVAPELDAAAWVERAKARGLVLHPPTHHFLCDPQPCLRLGFAQANGEELAEAVRRLRDALKAV